MVWWNAYDRDGRVVGTFQWWPNEPNKAWFQGFFLYGEEVNEVEPQ